MSDNAVKTLSFDALCEAVKKGSALRCRTRLQADAGDGGKVFPSTYAGGVYAVEDRRIDGRVVRCVLLDSVQSQANRMEEVLQEAFLPNWRELPTDGSDPRCDLPVVAVHIENHGWITSLTAPHRIHDAILRDSEITQTKKDAQGNAEKDDQGQATTETKRFRSSEIGEAIVKARLHDAIAFYRYCPTALLFGTWDSTAGEGLDSAKIPRAVVSEIIGVDITPGVRTGSRIDPLGIAAGAATIYRRQDRDWAAKVTEENGQERLIGANSEAEIERDKKGNLKKFGKGKPSDINHSNITPNLPRFERKEINDNDLNRLADILESNPLELRYEMQSQDGRLETHSAFRSDHVRIREGAVKPGGVTMAYALHTWTLSLTQLRRLHFPAAGNMTEQQAAEQKHDERDEACRTVLAALAIYALVLQQEHGYWLRSRCELIPDSTAGHRIVLERLNVNGTSDPFNVPDPKAAKDLLTQAFAKAQKAFSPNDCEAPPSGNAANAQSVPNPGWEQRVIRLTPTAKLLELVRASDRRVQSADADMMVPEGAETETEQQETVDVDAEG